jgi:adenylosuccinate synthase
MKSAKVVIGANFGDEGKGCITNYLSTKETTVVRFNGGAQAGHTVCMPDGRRHVFGHIGSGSFKGAATHLSRFFIINPLLFIKEYNKLGLDIKITANPKSYVTTHYDMLINQIVENYRTNKHGSCGVGINETIQRCDNLFNIAPTILHNEDHILARLEHIRNNYFDKRLDILGVPTKFRKIATSLDELDKAFVKASKFFRDKVELQHDEEIMFTRNIVFEGAQGLLLDQDSKYFPHVTHSKTGLDNVLELIKGSSIDHLDVYYVTRSYLTRHGNGPLPHEIPAETFDIQDETNITNKYQGSLRFAPLDTKELINNIFTDFIKIPRQTISTRSTSINVAITCLDQVEIDINNFNSFDSKLLSYSKYGPTL